MAELPVKMWASHSLYSIIQAKCGGGVYTFVTLTAEFIRLKNKFCMNSEGKLHICGVVPRFFLFLFINLNLSREFVLKIARVIKSRNILNRKYLQKKKTNIMFPDCYFSFTFILFAHIKTNPAVKRQQELFKSACLARDSIKLLEFHRNVGEMTVYKQSRGFAEVNLHASPLLTVYRKMRSNLPKLPFPFSSSSRNESG